MRASPRDPAQRGGAASATPSSPENRRPSGVAGRTVKAPPPSLRPGSVRLARREFYEELPSTQDRAVALAREGAPDGCRVVARRQSRGRGRGDRSWSSPEGGLYLSIVLRPAGETPLLPLAIGAELATSVAERYRARPRVKWPNDLLVVDGGGRARKMAGILVDVVPDSAGGRSAVAGIGVNVAWGSEPLPADVAAHAAALSELTAEPTGLDTLEADVARAAVAARDLILSERGRATVVARCRGLLYGRGDRVTVDGVPAGVVADLMPDGALMLQGPDGARAVLAGDVRVGVGG